MRFKTRNPNRGVFCSTRVTPRPEATSGRFKKTKKTKKIAVDADNNDNIKHFQQGWVDSHRLIPMSHCLQ